MRAVQVAFLASGEDADVVEVRLLGSGATTSGRVCGLAYVATGTVTAIALYGVDKDTLLADFSGDPTTIPETRQVFRVENTAPEADGVTAEPGSGPVGSANRHPVFFRSLGLILDVTATGPWTIEGYVETLS